MDACLHVGFVIVIKIPGTSKRAAVLSVSTFVKYLGFKCQFHKVSCHAAVPPFDLHMYFKSAACTTL